MKGKMLALHLLGNSKSEVRETDIPALHGNEVLVKVYASAICGSEKPQYRMNQGDGYTVRARGGGNR